jgi:hypothetical protein
MMMQTFKFLVWRGSSSSRWHDSTRHTGDRIRWNDGTIDGIEIRGITIVPFDRDLHASDSQSYRCPEQCAQGGGGSCPNEPFYSIIGPHYRVSACPVHLFGAVAQARESAREEES